MDENSERHSMTTTCIHKLNLNLGVNMAYNMRYALTGPGGGGGGTLIFSHVRRLGPFFWVQNSEFQYFLGFSEK